MKKPCEPPVDLALAAEHIGVVWADLAAESPDPDITPVEPEWTEAEAELWILDSAEEVSELIGTDVAVLLRALPADVRCEFLTAVCDAGRRAWGEEQVRVS